MPSYCHLDGVDQDRAGRRCRWREQGRFAESNRPFKTDFDQHIEPADRQAEAAVSGQCFEALDGFVNPVGTCEGDAARLLESTRPRYGFVYIDGLSEPGSCRVHIARCEVGDGRHDQVHDVVRTLQSTSRPDILVPSGKQERLVATTVGFATLWINVEGIVACLDRFVPVPELDEDLPRPRLGCRIRRIDSQASPDGRTGVVIATQDHEHRCSGPVESSIVGIGRNRAIVCDESLLPPAQMGERRTPQALRATAGLKDGDMVIGLQGVVEPPQQQQVARPPLLDPDQELCPQPPGPLTRGGAIERSESLFMSLELIKSSSEAVLDDVGPVAAWAELQGHPVRRASLLELTVVSQVQA